MDDLILPMKVQEAKEIKTDFWKTWMIIYFQGRYRKLSKSREHMS
jgi:hypothetical protein